MKDTPVDERIVTWARNAHRVCVLTGAGMSAESGVPTFRDIATGLWNKYSQSDLATAEALAEKPGTVWAWYSWRATTIQRVEPNAGHRALATWQRHTHVDIVTQNVDDLHERAGATVLAHLHGSIMDIRCSSCGAPSDATYPELAEPVEYIEPPRCQRCGNYVRSGIVLFGEMLPEGALDAGMEAACHADLVLVIGTSGMVYPAALLPQVAIQAGIPVVEINPNPTSDSFDNFISWPTTAATALPALLAELGYHDE